MLPDGRQIGNNTRYSTATSGHQSAAGVRAAAVVLNDVPRGTWNLADWYQGRLHMAAQQAAAAHSRRKP